MATSQVRVSRSIVSIGNQVLVSRSIVSIGNKISITRYPVASVKEDIVGLDVNQLLYLCIVQAVSS
jgi:hypothetical protein